MLAEIFQRAHLWPWLFVAPALVALALAVHARRHAQLDALVSPSRRRAVCGDLSTVQRATRIGCVVATIAAGAVAMLDPVYGDEVRIVEPVGVDILVALDVSRSMLARDLPPSRLERARREIESLADRARGDRLGLVAFAGEARLVVPLTNDVDTFRGLVSTVDTSSVRVGGTDLGKAIDVAVSALREAGADDATRHGVIVILTDGEDLEGHGLEAAKRAAPSGVRIHCIGFGSTRGSKIAVEASDGASESFLRGPEGSEVVSAMDADSLRKIAAETGGEFLRADAVPLPLLEIYDKRIVPMAKKTFEAEARRAKKHRFQWPLLVAVPLCLLSLGLTDRSRSRA